MTGKNITRDLKEQLRRYEGKGNFAKAAEACARLRRHDPKNPRWPQKQGELCRRLGDTAGAVEAFRIAAGIYARDGLVLKAIALCKVMLGLDDTNERAREMLQSFSTDREPAPGSADGAEAHPRAVGLSSEVSVEAAPVSSGALGDIELNLAVEGAREVPPPQEAGLFEIAIDTGMEPVAGGSKEGGTEEIVKTLPEVPLFSSLGRESLIALVGKVEIRHLDAGLHIIREGEIGDSLFILVEGEARAFHEGPPEVPLTGLKEGSFFGEIALLSNRQRSASVKAVTDCTLMVVSREVVHELIGEHFDTLPVLLRFFRERIVRSVLESNPLFSRFDDEERRRLVQRFAFFEAKSGTTLLQEGETGDGLFVLLCGDVEVSRERKPLGSYRTGSVFGEESLMKGEPASITVRTATKCWLLKMPRDTFREVIMTHGAILEVLGEEIEENRKRWDSTGGDGEAEEAGPLII